MILAPHWMQYVLFAMLVIALMAVVIVVIAYSHSGTRTHQAAGSWAGVVTACIYFASSADRFIGLPGDSTESSLALIVSETISLRWGALLVAVVVAAIAFEVAEVADLSDRVLAGVLLLITACATSWLVHLFIIRNANSHIFSWFVGSLLGFLLYRAFLHESAPAGQAVGGRATG